MTGKAETVPETAGRKALIRDGPLEGKVAIVTGGGRGLGRSMVLSLAGAGAKVIATDGLTGKRFDASKWPAGLPVEEASLRCARDAGVYEAEIYIK